MPNAADNSIIRINKVIEALGNYRSEVLLVPTVKRYLSEIAKEDSSLHGYFSRLLANPELTDGVLEELDGVAKSLADEIRPRIRMTVTPTMIHGGVKENVIPSECEAVFDCRILPGQSTAETFQLIRKLLKDVGLNKLVFETIQENEPSESPVETPLYKVITNVLKAFEPDCGVTPTMATGGTDSRFFRKMGSVCYGFHPMKPAAHYTKMAEKMHGTDECISIENLVFGASVLYEVVKRFMS